MRSSEDVFKGVEWKFHCLSPVLLLDLLLSASLDKVSLGSPAANASSTEVLQKFLTRSKRISLEKQIKDPRAPHH